MPHLTADLAQLVAELVAAAFTRRVPEEVSQEAHTLRETFGAKHETVKFFDTEGFPKLA